MDSFFSKASSFISSQAEEVDAPAKPSATHVPKPQEEHSKPAAGSSGGYGDLLSGMQSLMHSDEKKGNSTTEGYGNLLASAQAMMGGAKPSADHHGSDGHSKTVPPSAAAGDSDVAASAQVLMKAARARGEADMGEVAGAAANLIGAASQYGNVKGTSYGQYADKAQAYLHDYQASHGRKAATPEEHHEAPSRESEEEDSRPTSPPPSKVAPSHQPAPKHELDDE